MRERLFRAAAAFDTCPGYQDFAEIALIIRRIAEGNDPDKVAALNECLDKV